ncbi:MAG: hypothetical protein MUF84_20210 [Anaerolineae bacterium]|nr:hypothetical protein [Anaerolineae bacterium]
MDEGKLVNTVTRVGELLVRGEYATLQALTGSRRLTADEMRAAVVDYGRTLTLPPGGRFTPRSVVDIEESRPERWSVYVDLWTAEEGRSDLTLELTVSDSTGEFYEVAIDDLHVL